MQAPINVAMSSSSPAPRPCLFLGRYREHAGSDLADAVGADRLSWPSIPSARVMRSGASIFIAPSPRLNQPRLRALRSEAPNELGSVLMISDHPASVCGRRTRCIRQRGLMGTRPIARIKKEQPVSFL